MSRTPGASCLIDARTTAIMQDYVLQTNECAPGAAEALARRRCGGGYLIPDCEPPACGYDRSRDMVSVLGAMIVVATVIGHLHSLPIFIPAAAVEYNAGYIELCTIQAMAYFFTLCFACLTNFLLDFCGHKLAALCGMILIFLGLILESQVWHICVLYITNTVLLPIGTGLAYAASVTLPSDLFRAKIITGVTIINIAGSIGTIFYTWLIIYTIDVLGFKWCKLMIAFIVLFFTLAVHGFPKTRLMYTQNCDIGGAQNDKIKDCIQAAAAEDECAAMDPEKNCMCVCICDLRLYSDKSFILWSCLVMIAAMNFHIPYLYFVSYAETMGAQISAWYITIYCATSISLRCVFIRSEDYTFAFNRTLFQFCLIVSGIMWIVINWASTYGWLLVMCGILGAVEGILCTITSRVAIGTIPSTWISGAWVSCILFHALGMFMATVFTAIIALRTYHFHVAFITIGIIQIVVALLATLLPNEDDEGTTATAVGCAGCTTPAIPTDNCCGSIQPRAGCCSGYDYPKSSYSYRSPVSSTPTNRTDYKCKCPICSKIGCIPECLPDCAPAGATGQCC